MTLLQPIRQFFRNWAEAAFAIDLRTLALFRVALSCVLIADLVFRCADLRAFYTDEGVLSRTAAMVMAGPFQYSLFFANGNLAFAILFFLAHILAAIALLVGYRTRWATLICYVLHTSLVVRDQMVLLGGDDLYNCLLFWGIFLPLGARYSLDAAVSSTPPPASNRHYSWASAGITLQVISVYFFSAFLKTGREWWPDGTAVYYAMSIDSYATHLGQAVFLPHPLLMQGLTYFVFGLEMFGPLVALTPFASKPLRLLVMLLLMGMHTAFALSLAIGPFPYMSLSSLTLLLGGWVWDAGGRRWSRPAFAGKLPSIADLRDKYGETFWLRPRTVKFETGPTAQFFAGLLLFSLLAHNFNTIGIGNRPVMNLISTPLATLHMQQRWDMFAPYPFKDDGWLVIPGTLADGTQLDVYHPERAEISYAKPVHVVDEFANSRWRTYLVRLWYSNLAEHRGLYSRYLCRDWNLRAPPSKKLLNFQLVYMLEQTLPPGNPLPVPERRVLWTHECIARPAPPASTTSPADKPPAS